MIQIREAVVADGSSIYIINKNALGYEYPEEKTKVRLEYILKRETDKIYVAYEADKIIGYIHGADYECTYVDSVKNIMAIAVDEKYRGLGAGKKLLEAIEKWAEQDGCVGVRLVSGYNRQHAHEFYRHCGYDLRKDQKNFIKYFN